MKASIHNTWLSMSLQDRLKELRKERGLSQQELADQIGIHVNSIKKYETGQAQPSIDGLRRIAQAFQVSADYLIFDGHERSPDEDLAFLLEAVKGFRKNERTIIKEVLESLVIKYQTRRLDSSR